MRPYTINALHLLVLSGMFSLCTKTVQTPVEPCPESCSCTLEDTAGSSAVNVQCGEKNLTSVPYTTYDKPVFLLNVSFNNLTSLEENALFSYVSVEQIYLRQCNINYINEKAFRGLENLKIIDLASNRLTSVSPNLFNGNKKLEKLILRSNDFQTLKPNTTILNGPSSLSSLDLQFCKLSNISSITFSLLLNLTFLDISRNPVEHLNKDYLSSLKNLKVVEMKNNPLECGVEFRELMCWMQSMNISHKGKLKCHITTETFQIWSPEHPSLHCDSESTQSATSSHRTNISTSTKLNSASTPSHEPDISTSTNLNLASAPSHETDISTSRNLNPSSTLSHELDNSTNTILNTEVQHKEELVNNSIPWYWWLIGVVCLVGVFAGSMYVYKKYSPKCCTPEQSPAPTGTVTYSKVETSENQGTEQ